MSSRLPLVCVAAVLCAPPVLAQFVVQDDLNRFGVDDVEITPDGRYAVARENTQSTKMLIYDLVNGGPPVIHSAAPNQPGGAAQDAVAVTNSRAIMLGNRLIIADLSAPGTPVLAEHEVGYFARDLVITPDERYLFVRGGQTLFGNPGGQFVFDLANGALLGSGPGEPGDYFQSQYPFDVDSVVANNRYGVFTSFIDNSPNGFATRVTVWRTSGSPTPFQVVFETDATNDLDGVPHDITLSPDGRHVAIRSEFEVALLDVGTPVPSLVWTRSLFNQPGPLGLSVMDSIEMSDTRVATLSRWSNGGIGAQIDIFDLSGNQYFQLLFGDPHDLAVTPSGERVVARTSTQVLLYDLANLPTSGNQLNPLDFKQLGSTHTSFGAGLDSIVTTDDCAVACARVNEQCDIRVYDISNDRLDVTFDTNMNARPIDLDLSPDGTTAWISGYTHVLGIDLRTSRAIFEHDPTTGGGYPWCDGVAVGDGHAVAFGYTVDPAPLALLPPMSGWLSVLDTFTDSTPFCPPSINSTQAPALLHATGSARASANDLTMWATDVTPGVFGFFFYGDQVQQLPAGDGFHCIAGQVANFPVVVVGLDGVAGQVVDNSALPASGGALLAGSTWNFQFIYRDSSIFGTGFNLSRALAVEFTN